MITKTKTSKSDYLQRKRATLIREYREKQNLSQAELAEKMHMTRATYIQVEQGKRDLKVDEVKTLATALDITYEDLQEGYVSSPQKYVQMISAFLRSPAFLDKKIPKTKLAKLLYLADFGWYYDHLESMSGMKYKKLQYGPVPLEYFQILDSLEMSQKLELQRTSRGAILIQETDLGQEQSLDLLKQEERDLIDEIARRWSDRQTHEIVEHTHNQLPYLYGSEGGIIHYEPITQEDPGTVY